MDNEKIFEGHPFTEMYVGTKNAILKCMEEYASQFKPVDLREELIKYDKWCAGEELSPNLLSPESNVNKYLNSKQ